MIPAIFVVTWLAFYGVEAIAEPRTASYRGMSGACRNAQGKGGKYTKVVAATPQDCQDKCTNDNTCTAYEFTYDYGCEIHTGVITYAKPTPFYAECGIKLAESDTCAEKYTPSITCGGNVCSALRADGTATVWGEFHETEYVYSYYGYQPTILVPLSETLVDIAEITCKLENACVARKFDGRAFAWGEKGKGGDASSVDLTNVRSIECGRDVCVAIKEDNSAVAWGDHWNNLSSVDLTNVAKVSCGYEACAALKLDGTVEAWGSPHYGGLVSKREEPKLDDDFTNVIDVQCGDGACVLVKSNGKAIAWGAHKRGAAPSLYLRPEGSDLNNVARAECGHFICAALKYDGSVVSWGSYAAEDDSSAVLDTLNGVVDISCTYGFCTATKSDMTVVVWGDIEAGGDATSVDLTNVRRVSLGSKVGAVIRADGSADVWYGPSYTGYNPGALDLTKNVVDVVCAPYRWSDSTTCVVQTADGMGVAWGSMATQGADSSSVDLTNLKNPWCEEAVESEKAVADESKRLKKVNAELRDLLAQLTSS